MTWGVDSPVNLQLCLLGMGWLVDVLGGGGWWVVQNNNLTWHIIVDAEILLVDRLRLLLLEQGQFFYHEKISLIAMHSDR